MKTNAYQPGGCGEASARLDGDRWTLVFVRELRHAPHEVWRALTDPTQLAHWSPFDADRDLGRPGVATLTMAGAGGTSGEKLPAQIQRAEPPRLLEYTWGDDLLRWKLEPAGAGTRLTLEHTVADRTWLPKVAAGWHLCLDVAEALLADQPIGRIVAEDALAHGWQRLNDGYATHLGMLSEEPPKA